MARVTTRMHEDQIDVPADVVSGLVSEQFPQWRDLPLRPVISQRFARELAGFVRALRRIPSDGRGWDGRGRGGPLAEYDDAVRGALHQSRELTNTDRLARLWEDCLAAPPHDGEGVWLHADLMPGNLVLRDGRLVAVIDLGAVGVGDPAVDLMPAWNLLEGRARATYRRVLDVDDATWARGRGWALLQAVMALPYYVVTNPMMATTAAHTLAALSEE